MYEKLYLANHHGETEFCAYLHDLCRSLHSFQAPERAGVSLEVRCEALRLDIDRALPLGLFTTEFIVNSLRHAFPDGRGLLTVRLEALDGDRVRLLLADTGTGGRPALLPASGLGLRLMEQLAVQAEAALSWNRTEGTRAELIFERG